ncbi:DUF3224 domain-containing protein [Krasilnikovia sp. MM14-A1259]|uniref:DUF3224 domain-containing protein n=1 Tax=Krasilnikovia sp. MM14-A1259 TaxID=3373539 RepID=UPI0038147AF7
MGRRAIGTFTAVLDPVHLDDEAVSLARVDKAIDGDLVGTGRAQMLTVGTPVEGSAGYVAIDVISGSLHGRRGTFVLQHSGILDRGAGTATVTVVPDSGTDELVGLRGTFHIENLAGEHRYVFEYDIHPD